MFHGGGGDKKFPNWWSFSSSVALTPKNSGKISIFPFGDRKIPPFLPLPGIKEIIGCNSVLRTFQAMRKRVAEEVTFLRKHVQGCTSHVAMDWGWRIPNEWLDSHHIRHFRTITLSLSQFREYLALIYKSHFVANQNNTHFWSIWANFGPVIIATLTIVIVVFSY